MGEDHQNGESTALTQQLTIGEAPALAVQQGQECAKLLKDIIASKRGKNNPPLMFQGKQYLEYEDWQVIGKFYGVTAKIEWTRPIEMDKVQGFESRAVLIQVSTGREISAAEAMCMNDERNWKSKPLYQLRSMAQTRACSKAHKNVLSWVAVLAGYGGTPAEEMDGVKPDKQYRKPQPRQQSQPRSQPPRQESRGADPGGEQSPFLGDSEPVRQDPPERPKTASGAARMENTHDDVVLISEKYQFYLRGLCENKPDDPKYPGKGLTREERHSLYEMYGFKSGKEITKDGARRIKEYLETNTPEQIRSDLDAPF